ncbi:MAG: 4Fe-4S binding protein [Thermodesulfobacteriota bacterium]
MCEFCVSHGEGKKWYENMANYSREVFDRVNSEERLHHFLLHFGEGMRKGLKRAETWRRLLPWLYDRLVFPVITRRQKRSHFGQIIPIEDVEVILERVQSVVRLPCICRKVSTGQVRRCCYGVGLDLTHLLADQPDFRDFDRIGRDEARAEMRDLDGQGMTHSVWTFQTPFIGAICNCDQDCMAYKIHYERQLARVMWKAEYVAVVDSERCKGCKRCRTICPFAAVSFDRRLKRCSINAARCYGCGVCRAVCEEGAISLQERELVPGGAGRW